MDSESKRLFNVIKGINKKHRPIKVVFSKEPLLSHLLRICSFALSASATVRRIPSSSPVFSPVKYSFLTRRLQVLRRFLLEGAGELRLKEICKATCLDHSNMYFEGYGYHGNSFEQTYRCYPASFIDKPQLEAGDKIIMPPSALDRLASLHIDYPMLFELRNAATERFSHCGVLEFIAEEGMIYMPYWMMQNLLLQEGDIVLVKNATLPKGTYVKLQPHTMDFLDISNPKAILETTLRNFSCLTTGDSIMVAYNNRKYYIDIVETKPSSAISIIETDCEVDFAPPLDYKEPERPQPPAISTGKVPAQDVDGQAEDEVEEKFTPFTGVGRRLDGKASSNPPLASTSPAKDSKLQAVSVTKQSSSPASGSSSSGQATGKKLVFGSNANRNSKEAQPKIPPKESKEESAKKDEPKFHAFTGKKYSLKG